MQLKDTKLKLCIIWGRGSNQKNVSFLRRCKLLKFHTDSLYVMMFMIYKFHNNLFFSEWPKIFEYLVAKFKKRNNFDYSF